MLTSSAIHLGLPRERYNGLKMNEDSEEGNEEVRESGGKGGKGEVREGEVRKGKVREGED